MRFFIDTGSVAEVEEIAAWGILSGATTNPTLLAKEDGDPGDIIGRICELVKGPVSAEVVSDDAAAMVDEGRALNALHEHVIVKVPFSSDGLRATRILTDEGIQVNMTLVFSANQALLTAQAGATYASCFMGRLDDATKPKVFLQWGERVFAVGVGDVIEGRYRVERIDANQVTLMYLPLNLPQTLPFGSS